MLKIAINGFGRIGRAAFKAILQNNKAEVVAINDLTDTKTLAQLLRYDSVYGPYDKEVKAYRHKLSVAGKKYRIFNEKDPAMLPWQELNVDIVIESTGVFRTKEKAAYHLQAGAKKVIISAPAKSDDIKSIVLGVNEKDLKKSDKIISMASCTTNCLTPLTEIIRKNFGIEKALMTTIHSYTASQNLVDGPHKDPRRGRAAAVNIVPTTTGAALATTRSIPSLKGKFDGMAVRVPTPVGSLCDAVYLTKKNLTEDKFVEVIKREAAKKRYQGILVASQEPIVSSDIVGNPASSIVDLPMTKVIGGNMLKVISWYDNEWGYSNRLADLCYYIKSKKFL